jgi:hypothetical protein
MSKSKSTRAAKTRPSQPSVPRTKTSLDRAILDPTGPPVPTASPKGTVRQANRERLTASAPSRVVGLRSDRSGSAGSWMTHFTWTRPCQARPPTRTEASHDASALYSDVARCYQARSRQSDLDVSPQQSRRPTARSPGERPAPPSTIPRTRAATLGAGRRRPIAPTIAVRRGRRLRRPLRKSKGEPPATWQPRLGSAPRPATPGTASPAAIKTVVVPRAASAGARRWNRPAAPAVAARRRGPL